MLVALLAQEPTQDAGSEADVEYFLISGQAKEAKFLADTGLVTINFVLFCLADALYDPVRVSKVDHNVPIVVALRRHCVIVSAAVLLVWFIAHKHLLDLVS